MVSVNAWFAVSVPTTVNFTPESFPALVIVTNLPFKVAVPPFIARSPPETPTLTLPATALSTVTPVTVLNIFLPIAVLPVAAPHIVSEMS